MTTTSYQSELSMISVVILQRQDISQPNLKPDLFKVG